MFTIGDFPHVRGVLRENEDIGKKSFFGVGGPAQFFFIPEDMNDLVFFLRELPEDMPITILGSMSNVLIRSGGIRGVVIVLGEWFSKIFVENSVLEVGAAVSCSKLSTVAMNNELTGFEFLMGIPGTIGGAIKMNAGCYEATISSVLVECEGISSSGQIKWLKSSDIGFAYRTSKIPDDLIITRAWFRGIPNAGYSIPKKVNEITAKRRNNQPLSQRSCGSAFKNPNGKKAWELIEAAGCRGMRLGGAMISEKHCNFIVNDNNATADDIENLGELVIQKVLENSGIRLEWEILRLGNKRSAEQ
ncbi:MAG: UDP-N-acetylmuramate dehydrogenase [Holosporaceae bacterium]|jgi:UDP-N-acetylmuramate dehydrogenase|nr:UDP-N-acetylmuramate dehydrogenase [Holosporaceae bacterium]